MADEGTVFPFLVIGVAALGVGTLYLLFPHGLHFAFGASAGVAVYACLFPVMARAAFPDALNFSLVTQATVGYGDVTPHDDGIRLLASVQVIAGQVLLLFGFAEIMRTRRVAGAEPRRPGPAGD